MLTLLDKIGPDTDDLIVSVGDFLDRGPGSVEVVDLLRVRPNTVALVGNHECKDKSMGQILRHRNPTPACLMRLAAKVAA